MKNLAIVVLTLAVVALGTWGVSDQSRIRSQAAQLAQTRARLAAVEAEVRRQSDLVERARFAEANEKMLQQLVVESSASVAEESRQSEHLKRSLAAGTNDPLQGIAAMFKDPKMRELIKSQQQAIMGPMIDRQYGALFQQLNLTPGQVAALKALLEKKMSAGTDAGFSMLDGSLDASQRAELARQIRSRTEDAENQIQQLLGDEDYQALQTYEKTVPDRTAVSQFSDQLAGTPTALSAQQQAQLIQAMGDARNDFQWSADLDPQNLDSGNYAAMFTGENIETFTREMERNDEQVLTRAQQILTPAQLAAFQDFQRAQRQLQIAGMKMAGQMFAPKSQ
ncbi:MAG: hypothetical protein KGJ60_01220 [Verrucomicrobiota bacterium]|nr:hypothetical protein [Verrucomicrobiota bacterium]